MSLKNNSKIWCRNQKDLDTVLRLAYPWVPTKQPEFPCAVFYYGKYEVALQDSQLFLREYFDQHENTEYVLGPKRLVWMEDVNSLVSRLIDEMVYVTDTHFEDYEYDLIFDKFQEILSEYSENIDYKNYN